MLTNPQKGLLKRAQAEAGLEDVEYRDAIEMVSALPGCRSSTDARLTDDHFDSLMSYIDAIYWRKVDTEDWHLHSCNGFSVFVKRGYWPAKNQRGDTSRDRFTGEKLRGEIQQAEQALADLGYDFSYVQGIQNRIVPFSLVNYLAALTRTLKSKRKASQTLPGV